MPSPLVSIIIPAYNRPDCLVEALESALQQTYSNTEVIVINDGSPDENTEKVLEPYMEQIRYIYQENRGLPATKNRGLELAKGELLCNLDDDDRFHPEKVERQVEMFSNNPDLGLCATGANFYNGVFLADKLAFDRIPPPLSPKTQVLELLRSCCLVQSSVMIHRKCHDHLGDYKPILSSDYEFWLRVAPHYAIGTISECLTDYRIHGSQLTQTASPQITEETRELLRDFTAQTPIEQIIPGIRCHPEGYVLVGLLICQHKYFELAQSCFKHTLPHPAGHLGSGVLKMGQKDFSEATRHFEKVRATNSAFASKAEDALRLVERIQTVYQTPKLDNNSPVVVELRKDLSAFHTKFNRFLLRSARGESIENL